MTRRHAGASTSASRKAWPALLAYAGSALFWIPQAALIAWAIGTLGQNERDLAPIARAAGAVLALGLARTLLEAWGSRRLFIAARQQVSELRAAVVEALALRSPLDKQRPASGMAASMVAEQAEAIIPWLTRYQGAQWRTAIAPLAILLAVAVHSWVAALVLLGAAPLIPLFMAIVGWRAQAASEAQMVELGRLNAFLLDRLRGLATLRAMRAVDATARQVLETGQNLKERAMAVLRIAFLSSAVLELFAALGVALVAVYIGFHLLGELPFGAWGRKLSLAQGLFVLLLAPAFFEPLRELSAAWHDRASGMAAINQLQKWSQAAEQSVIAPHRETMLTTAAPAAVTPQGTTASGLCVAFDRVTFAHAGEAPVLQDFSLTIAAGEHLALTGPSGSGKTVLLALLAGLLAPQQGRIHIGALAWSADNAPALRRQIAWLGQKPHIFTGSIRHNIALGRTGLSRQQLAASLQRSGLATVMARLPGQILGEGGSGFSGGEIARLALARLAANPEARLLLLDEPTAHLDTETARQVIDTIMELARGKTLLVATHDPLLIERLPRHITLPLAPLGTQEQAS